MLLLSLCLKDSTDGEFIVSSERVFQMRVVEGVLLGSCSDCLNVRLITQIILTYMVQVRRGIQVPKN